MFYYLMGANETTRLDLRGAHSAAADVRFCHKVLLAIIEQLEIESLGTLWQASEEARIPKIMTFGKHKGKPVSEVDAGYIQWYRRQPDTDPYLLMAFSRYCK